MSKPRDNSSAASDPSSEQLVSEKDHLADLSARETDRVHGRQIDNQNHEQQGKQTTPRELQNRRNLGRGPQ